MTAAGSFFSVILAVLVVDKVLEEHNRRQWQPKLEFGRYRMKTEAARTTLAYAVFAGRNVPIFELVNVEYPNIELSDSGARLLLDLRSNVSQTMEESPLGRWQGLGSVYRDRSEDFSQILALYSDVLGPQQIADLVKLQQFTQSMSEYIENDLRANRDNPAALRAAFRQYRDHLSDILQRSENLLRA